MKRKPGAGKKRSVSVKGHDRNTLIMIAIVLFLVSYAASYLLLTSIIPTERTFHMMSIPDYNRIIFIHVVSVVASSAIAYFSYSYLRSQGQESAEDGRIYAILSEDEKAALKEIKRSGSISQDSLRFRLGWSKAKTSSIVTRLEKYRLIQRERIGKTYRLVPE